MRHYDGGWLDSNTANGMRITLAEEFSDIHILNLRGNQRTTGEQSRKEGGKVFGVGSRASVAVTIFVKDPSHAGPARIHYTDIGDYLTREEKLAAVASAERASGLERTQLTPNVHGDWLSQRRDDFKKFVPVGAKDGEPATFSLFSGGLKTNRDAWCYNFSADAVATNMQQLVATYEADRAASRTSSTATNDASLISWNRGLLADLDKGRERAFDRHAIRAGAYRPFTREHVYFDRALNDMVYRLTELFPTPRHSNHGFVVMAPRPEASPALLMVGDMPDLSFYSYTGQFFPRWRYEKVASEGGMLSFETADSSDVLDGYRRIDNITDEALRRFQAAYGPLITKDDVFFYVYGLLHSPDYRDTYAADLKKMLPRIPLVEDGLAFIDAGRRLAELHLDYETVTPHPLEGLDTQPPTGCDPYQFYAVGDKKMAFGKPTVVQKAAGEKRDRTTIVYNSNITLGAVPEEAYRYMLGSRTAIDWIIDRYYIKADKPSGIVNDPNSWSREVNNPRYILELLARVVTVSVETMKIVDALPPLVLCAVQTP